MHFLSKISRMSLLLVVACSGGTKNPSGTSNQAPLASFSVSGDAVALGTMIFDASASTDPDGDKLRYDWQFGDQSRGGVTRLAHLYAAPGTFTVKLTVTDPSGAQASEAKQVQIGAGTASAGAIPLQLTVRDLAGAVVVGADVAVEGSPSAAVTDPSGAASVSVGTGIEQTVRITKPGFARQLRTVSFVPSLASAKLDVVLVPRAAAQKITDITVGGSVTASSGAKLELPAKALVDEQGNAITGEVEVSVTPVDVRNARTQFPGGFGARDQNGDRGLMLSFGVLEFALSQGSKALNLAPGATATTEVPMYAGKHADGRAVVAGDEIPLWSLDERTGTWVQEGVGLVVASAASPSGFAMRATLGHFSWWNCDAFANSGSGQATCRAIDVTATDEQIQAVEAGICTIGSNFGDEGPFRQSAASPPVFAAETQIPFNTTVSLAMPAMLNMNFTANAMNGTWGGALTARIDENNGEVILDLVVSKRAVISTEPVAITIPTERTDVISAANGKARYTLTSPGGPVVVKVGASGSLVTGSLTVARSGQAPFCTEVFAGALGECPFTTEANEVVDIEVIALSGTPGAIQVIAEAVVIDEGDRITLPFDTTFSAEAAVDKSWTFALNAGDAVEITSFKLGNSLGQRRIKVAEQNTGITSIEVSQPGSFDPSKLRLIAPRTGDYTVTSVGSGVEVNVTISALDLSDKTTTVSAYPFFADNAASAGVHFYKFTATAGQKFGYTARRADSQQVPSVTIHTPLANVRQDAANGACHDFMPIFTAPTAGDYYLEIDGEGVAAPLDISISPVTSLPPGTSNMGTEPLAMSEARFFQFTRTDEPHMIIGSFNVSTCLYDPAGADLEYANSKFRIYDMTIGGSYTVITVAPPATARPVNTWAVGVNQLPATIASTDEVLLINHSLTEIGQAASYSVDATVGQYIAPVLYGSTPLFKKIDFYQPASPNFDGDTLITGTASDVHYCPRAAQAEVTGAHHLWVASGLTSYGTMLGAYTGKLIKRSVQPAVFGGDGALSVSHTLEALCDLKVTSFTPPQAGVYRLRARYKGHVGGSGAAFDTEVRRASSAPRLIVSNCSSAVVDHNGRFASTVVELAVEEHTAIIQGRKENSLLGSENAEFEVISIAQPTTLPINTATGGSVDRNGRQVFYRVTIPASGTFSATVTGSVTGRFHAYRESDATNWFTIPTATNQAIGGSLPTLNATAVGQVWIIAVVPDEVVTGSFSITVSQ